MSRRCTHHRRFAAASGVFPAFVAGRVDGVDLHAIVDAGFGNGSGHADILWGMGMLCGVCHGEYINRLILHGPPPAAANSVWVVLGRSARARTRLCCRRHGHAPVQRLLVPRP